MPKRGRPRKPSTTSIARILSECGTGPRTWTQLVDATQLDPHTLSDTCRFLVQNEVIARKILPRHGHHVAYSVTEEYRKDRKRQRELELTEAERQELEAYRKRRLRAIRDYVKYQERFRRYWSEEDIFASKGWPKLKELRKRQAKKFGLIWLPVTRQEYTKFVKLSREVEAQSYPINKPLRK